MTHNKFDGYDIIGDIHGCATELESLLTRLDYRQGDDGAYRHQNRQALYVGDLIDRGPEQLRVLRIVKGMVDAGAAQMVLGNHEFNAMAYHTEDPAKPGKYLRPNGDPTNTWSAKNERQHAAFLKQVEGADRDSHLKWFWTQPLWLDLGEIRVVHACWHPDSISLLESALGGDRFRTVAQLARASDPGDELYTAVETILKGPEISLVDHQQPAYLDKDGIKRKRARMRWWDPAAVTLRDLAEMGDFRAADGTKYPPLPNATVAEANSHRYTDAVPVFYGHYWRRGKEPVHQQDWTDYTACVDFSAIKSNVLMAYRWSAGEDRIDPSNYVWVAAREFTTEGEAK